MSLAVIVEKLYQRYPALLRASIIEALRKRIAEAEKELRKVEAKLEELRGKYGMSLEEYEKNMDDSFEAHEAWIEWRFLWEAKKSLEEELNELHQLLRKALTEVQEHNSKDRKA